MKLKTLLFPIAGTVLLLIAIGLRAMGTPLPEELTWPVLIGAGYLMLRPARKRKKQSETKEKSGTARELQPSPDAVRPAQPVLEDNSERFGCWAIMAGLATIAVIVTHYQEVQEVTPDSVRIGAIAVFLLVLGFGLLMWVFSAHQRRKRRRRR